MIEELFRQVVFALVRSPFSIGLAHWEFRFAVLCVMYSDERWKLPFHAERLARRADPDNVLKVRIGQIADIRDRWLNPGLGFFIRCDYHGDDGLEIAPQFRRDRSRKADDPPPQQMELPIPKGIGLLPAPPNSPPRVRKDSDSEKEILTDSTLGARSNGPPCQPASGNRDVGMGKESGKSFARKVAELVSSPLGRRVHDYIGQPQIVTEMQASGAEWLRIIADEPDSLGEILDTLENSRHLVKTGLHRAQTLTGKLGEWRKSA